MSQIFNCPSCSASLDYDGGDHATVQCSYCGNTVIVPDSMRSKAKNVSTLFTRTNQLKDIVDLINDGKQAEAVELYAQTFNVSHSDAHSAVSRLASGMSLAMNQIQVQSYGISNDPNIQTYQSSSNAGRTIGCLVLVIFLFTFGIIAVTTIIPLAASGIALSTIFEGEDPIAGISDALATAEASSATIESGGSITFSSTSVPGAGRPDPTATPSAVNLVTQFGTEGIAPGQLNDARALAVSADGSIYIADRDSGRLQILDNEGKVQGQWDMGEDRLIDAVELDRAGHLYTIERSDIYRYDVTSGEQQTQYQYPGFAVSYSSIAATASNELVAINRIGGEIIRFDANGNSTLLNSAENVPDASGFEYVAVDGKGNIYVIGTAEDALGNRQDVVFKFNSDGEYVSQFGQSGSDPGSFRSPRALAVDGKGRIFVADIFGVHIFTGNGAFITFFPVEGAVFDLEFNDQGQLVVTNRNTVFIYDINIE